MQNPLSNKPELDMYFVGIYFLFDSNTIVFWFMVQMLIAGTTFDFLHRLHPKFISKRTQRMNGRFECALDFKSESIEFDDGDGVKSQISRDQNPTSASGMDDPNKSHKTPEWFPDEIETIIEKFYVVVVVKGACGFKKLVATVAVAELESLVNACVAESWDSPVWLSVLA